MPFYMTPENRPVPEKRSRLQDRLYNATHQIIVDELDSGATSEELLGMMISFISNDIGEQTILRQVAIRKAEREGRKVGS